MPGLHVALQSSQTGSPFAGLVLASSRRGAGSCQPGIDPPWSLHPGIPTGTVESEATVCGGQSREEACAEAGDKLREMTDYSPHRVGVGPGVEPWPGEAAHNYHSSGVS